MSDTDLQNIQNRLQDKFNEEADLIAGERKRAIVFWYDGKKSYEDIIDDLHLTCKGDEVKIIKVKSYFETKYLLEHEDTTSHFLLYFPENRAQPQENWLEDIRLYSTEFNADKLAIEIDECKIEGFENLSLGQIYDKLQPYEDFFNNKQRKERFIRFYSGLTNNAKASMDSIYLCMLAACVKAQNPDNFKSIAFPVFAGELDGENEAWNAIEISNLADKFWEFAREYYGYLVDEVSIKDLWYKILLGGINYKAPGLKIWDDKKYREFIFMVADNKKIIGSHINTLRAYSSLEDWAKNKDFIESYIKLTDEFIKNRKLNYESFLEDLEKGTEIKNLCVIEKIDEYVINYLRSLLNKDQKEKIEDIISYRKNTSWWYDNYKNEYEFIQYCSRFETYIKSGGLREETVIKMWDAYTSTYYKVDQNYRKLLASYSKLSTSSQNSFKEVLEYYNKAYAQWVEDINNRWCELLEHEGYQSDWNKGPMNKQWNFWNDYVLGNLKPKGNYSKVLVIISDAFRYEAAKELSERLPLGNTCEFNISSVFGCLPSFTQLGMASLLPHEDLHFHNSEKEWTVDSGDQSTTGLENRNKILQAANEKAVAYKWEDFKNLKSDEQWAKLKDMNVVYIYHDIIDSSAKSNEDDIPLRTEDCIKELQTMMYSFAYSPFNFSRIIVTADHGHLYQMKELEDTDKSRRTTASHQDTSRFAIGKTDLLEKEKAEKNYNDLVVHLDYIGEKDLSVSTPWSDKRYKKPGEYSKFDHGGATLQEILVPVIEYSYKGKNQELISQAKIVINTIPSIVTTNTIKLTVTQVEEVDGEKIIPGEYKIYIRRKNNQEAISREIIFKADKKSSQPSERQTEILLDLLPVSIQKNELCELHIESTNTLKNNYEQNYNISLSIGIMDEFF